MASRCSPSILWPAVSDPDIPWPAIPNPAIPWPTVANPDIPWLQNNLDSMELSHTLRLYDGDHREYLKSSLYECAVEGVSTDAKYVLLE